MPRTGAAADLAGEVLPDFDGRTIAQAIGRHAVTAGVNAPKAVNRLWLQLHRADAVVAKNARQRGGRRHRRRVADARLSRRGHQVIVKAGPHALDVNLHLTVEVDDDGARRGVCQRARQHRRLIVVVVVDIGVWRRRRRPSLLPLGRCADWP